MNKKKSVLFIVLWVTLIIAIGSVSFLVSFKLVSGSAKKSLTDQELQDLDYVNEKLEELRDSRDYAAMDNNEKMDVVLKTIRELSKEGKINEKSIHVDYENHYLTYQYKCGVLGGEIIGGHKKGFASSGDKRNIAIDYEDNDEFYKCADPIGKALIMNTLDASGSDTMNPGCRDLAKRFMNAGVSTTLITNVTLDDLLHLNEYDIALIAIHGSKLTFNLQSFAISTPKFYVYTLMALEQDRTPEMDRKYEKDLKDKCILYVNGKYAISPVFIMQHYTKGELEGKIFSMVSCELMGYGDNDSEAWTKSLIDHAGLSAFIGFHNEVLSGYAFSVSDSFLTDLINGETAKTAFDRMLITHGETDKEWNEKRGRKYPEGHPGAYPVFRGDEDAVIKWKDKPTPVPTAAPTPEPTPIPTSSPMQETTTESTFIPDPNAKVIIEDARREEYDQYKSKLINRYPKITIKGVDTSAINKKMAKELTTKVKPLGDNMFEGKAANYEYYIGDNIVTILAYLDELSFEYRDYLVYNISISTGKAVSGSQQRKGRRLLPDF